MLKQSAEASFRAGMGALEAGHPRDALSLFHAALAADQDGNDEVSAEARYLSYYGLCLCLTRTSCREALRCCRAAVQTEDYRAALWWNLGRVALVARRRQEAHKAFRRGLGLDPNHAGIRRDLRRMGVRRPPVLTVVSRSNPVNVFLGRLRVSCERRWPDGLSSPALGVKRPAPC